MSKNLVVFNIILKNILEFFLYYQILNVEATFLLIPLQNYYFIKKRDDKKDSTWP